MAEPTTDPQTPAADAALIAVIAGILAVPAASPVAMLGPLMRLLRPRGLSPTAVGLALRIVTRARVGRGSLPGPARPGSLSTRTPGPPSSPGGTFTAAGRDSTRDPGEFWRTGPAFPTPDLRPEDRAQARTVAEEVNYRAAFLLNSSRRISEAWKHGRTPAQQALVELQYWRLHQQAELNRTEQARLVDVAAQSFGPVLGWYSREDERVSPECARAHGRNFRADRRPIIGWPGTVHPRCRCRAGAPFATAKQVDQAVSAAWLVRHGKRTEVRQSTIRRVG